MAPRPRPGPGTSAPASPARGNSPRVPLSPLGPSAAAAGPSTTPSGCAQPPQPGPSEVCAAGRPGKRAARVRPSDEGAGSLASARPKRTRRPVAVATPSAGYPPSSAATSGAGRAVAAAAAAAAPADCAADAVVAAAAPSSARKRRVPTAARQEAKAAKAARLQAAVWHPLDAGQQRCMRHPAPRVPDPWSAASRGTRGAFPPRTKVCRTPI